MKKVVLIVIGILVVTMTSCARRVVAVPPASSKVVVVNNAPRNYTIVKIRGKRYYRWNGNHYRKTRNGYVLVRL